MKTKFVRYYVSSVSALALCCLFASFARADVSNGKAIYEKKCLKCHGSTGNADGPSAAMLAKKPGVFSDANLFKDKENLDMTPDERMAKIIRSGGLSVGKSKLMQAYPSFSDDEIKDLISYLKTFPQAGKGQGKH